MLDRDYRFPHLLPVDADIWRQHLEAHFSEYSQLEYDVRVGDGRDPGPGFDRNMRDMAYALSCRRIDVVAHVGSGLQIIEVTHSAGFTAIGQLISYPILYRDTYPGGAPLRPILVAGEIQTDITPVLERLGIMYYTYPLSQRPAQPRSLPHSTEVSDQT